MIKSQKGFTLIELVMVIVILGILAAVAIPKYVDMSNQAMSASMKGVCGNLKSSAAILIASSYSGKPLGTLPSLSDVIANTTIDGATVTGGAEPVVITIQGSTNSDCNLTSLTSGL